MFPLGHVGLTLAPIVLLQRRVPALQSLPLAFLAVGALLPDLIDKPLGHALLDLGNGRLVAHSLLFLVPLAGATLVAHVRATRLYPALAALLLGSAFHLAYDQMWRDLPTLLWPLLGAEHPVLGIDPASWWARLLTDPFTQATEALGAIGLAWVAWTRRPVALRARVLAGIGDEV